MGDFSMIIKFNILRFRNRIRSMADNRLTKKLYAWNLSLSGRYLKNWTGIEKQRGCNRDFSGLLNSDEIWDSLAKLEANKWKEAIPKDSDTEGRSTGKLSKLPQSSHMSADPTQ